MHIEGGSPPAGVGEQSQPLGIPAAAPSGTGPYVFMSTQAHSSAPVAYDPCRLIHVVLNDRTAPPGADAVVRAALERASQVSGIQFVIDGPTNEAPSPKRPSYQPKRYPGRWAPVLIAWSDPAETPALAGRVAGIGGSASLSVSGGTVYLTGGVTLDGPDLAVGLRWSLRHRARAGRRRARTRPPPRASPRPRSDAADERGQRRPHRLRGW